MNDLVIDDTSAPTWIGEVFNGGLFALESSRYIEPDYKQRTSVDWKWEI